MAKVPLVLEETLSFFPTNSKSPGRELTLGVGPQNNAEFFARTNHEGLKEIRGVGVFLPCVREGKQECHSKTTPAHAQKI